MKNCRAHLKAICVGPSLFLAQRAIEKGAWPASPSIDDLVNFAHKTDACRENRNNFMIMRDIRFRKVATLTVLEPFFADLIAADSKFPDLLRDTAKANRPWSRISSPRFRGIEPDRIATPTHAHD